LKLCNNNPFKNKIPAIAKLVLSPYVAHFMIRSPCYNKTPL
jgi:hypothetical protein